MGEHAPHSRWQRLGDGRLWKGIPYLQRLGNLLRRSAVTSVMAVEPTSVTATSPAKIFFTGHLGNRGREPVIRRYGWEG